MMTIIGSIVNINVEGGGEGEGLYNPLMGMKIFTLTMNMIYIQAPKLMRKVAMASIWSC